MSVRSEPMNDVERVVVTGMGVVSPLGSTVDDFHEAMVAGTCGITEIEYPWPTAYKSLRAGQVQDANFDHDAERFGRASQFAIESSRQAVHNAGLELPVREPRRVGVVVGTAMGDATEVERDWQVVRCNPDNPPQALDIRMRLGNLSDRVANSLGTEGPRHLVATTCAAGNHAIAWSSDLLRSGAADIMVAIGADTIGYVDMLGFTRLLLQAPERCQPFDRHRKGTILSEGAGALVLETLAGAKKRGANIVAEVLGCGMSCDAAGPFASQVTNTRGLRVAFQRALRRARINPDAIQYVNAHGSATRLNDHKETVFLKEVLGDHAYKVPVSGIKGMLGHTQGAASLLEAIACVLSLNRNVAYPTINWETPDPNCDLDYVPNEAREHSMDIALSNAFGVGGNNAILILSRWGG